MRSDGREDGVLGALDAGLVAGLLTEPAPGRVRFTHALVRDTLLADRSSLRATRMHGRIAAGLERIGSSEVSALAHHFARSAASATAAKAVHYCLRAADLAAGRYAHDAGADLLATALDCFDRTPADPSEDRRPNASTCWAGCCAPRCGPGRSWPPARPGSRRSSARSPPDGTSW